MPDIPLNPSTLVTNGQLVSATNPLPVTSVGGVLPPAGTDVMLNPRTFVVNGALVSATNPLPITLVTTEAQAWQAAVVANGGTVSAARMQIVSTFINNEKFAGTWDLTDDYWALWGESAIQSRTSLKQRRLATEVAVPLWTIDRGYTFNGTTQYINTSFVPSTHAVAMTGTNLRIAVYERTNLGSGGVSAGCSVSASNGLYIGANSSGNMVPRTNTTTGFTFALPVNDSRGYAAASRNGLTAAECFGYKNGGALVQSGSVTFAATLPTVAINIGAQNNNGVPASFRPAAMGFVCLGAALTPAQELAQYNNIQAWATAIGANV